MVENDVLRAIRERRSVLQFTGATVSEEHVEAILEAGRWAPSYINSQPWEFIVVRDERMRSRVSNILRRVTISWQGFAQAPLLIVVAVDSALDPRHHLEDGAAAVQNMAIVAHSLGLATFWAGILDQSDSPGSPEDDLRTLLGVPRRRRLIAVLPVGVAAYQPRADRKPLSEIVHRDRFNLPPTGARATPEGAQTPSPESKAARGGKAAREGKAPSGRPNRGSGRSSGAGGSSGSA